MIFIFALNVALGAVILAPVLGMLAWAIRTSRPQALSAPATATRSRRPRVGAQRVRPRPAVPARPWQPAREVPRRP